MQISAEPGTYVLVMHESRPRSVQVGRLGRVHLAAGYYLYVGSAFGPGGLQARIMRHLRGEKTVHWHIDYLSPQDRWQEVWFTPFPEKMEHRLAKGLLSTNSVQAGVPGFGASDCSCVTHLFSCPRRPSPAWLEAIMIQDAGSAPGWLVRSRKTR